MLERKTRDIWLLGNHVSFIFVKKKIIFYNFGFLMNLGGVLYIKVWTKTAAHTGGSTGIILLLRLYENKHSR